MSELKDLFKEINIELDGDKEVKFQRYYELLIEWNSKFNLTAITDYDEVMIKHFLDSLSIIKAVDIKTCSNLIDVGTGAGFPGIPIAIVFPDIKITLLDSLNKRVSFLNEVIDELGLVNVKAFHGRAEDYGRGEFREKYDICVSRAVANLSTLTELCLPFVKMGGFFAAYKSEKVREEVESADKAIDLLGGKISEVVNFVLPSTDFDRSIVIINKIKETSMKYPRKAGTPSKQPL